MATNKHAKTATENQTAPMQTNASIYRAGQNPNQSIGDENDQNMITNSYILSDKLQSNQQPTFVDALKHRIDASGRRITRSQLLKKRKYQQNNNNNNTHSTPIPPTIQTQTQTQTHSIQSNTNTQQNTQIKPESENDSSDDSSDDFDMHNLDNLTVPEAEHTATHSNTNTNEADDIRQKFRQRLQLQKQQLQQQENPVIITDTTNTNNMISDHESEHSDSDSDSESEYETASDSSDDNQQNINPRKRKIQFLNKQKRQQNTTNTNKISLEEEAAMLEQLEMDREATLKEQTTQDVLNYIREEEKQEREGDKSDEELPDDNDYEMDDGEHGQKEFELWKLREIRRNLREENIRKQRETDKYDMERRRKMSDDEIMRENERLGLHKEKKKGNMKFMQKYYHSGVFYRDNTIVDEKVLDRNFNAPTGQDKYINYEKVPQAMKRKNFGKMSQSKWTHLAAEDTTFDKEDREWFKKRKGVSDGEKEKMKKERYRFRHKAHENNFWFHRAGTGNMNRPSYKDRNVSNSNNKRFEKSKGDKKRGIDRRARSRSPHRKSRRRNK